MPSNPQVQGGGELSALRLAIEAGGHFSQDLAYVPVQTLRHIGESYLAVIKPLVQGRSRLVDKIPANFFYAGLMPLILPGARIIHCRRDPVDICMSCYGKQFGGDQCPPVGLIWAGKFMHRNDAFTE